MQSLHARQTSSRDSTLILLITLTLSGFTRLIYKSVWTRHLGLLLGQCAYAQALVLIVFMRGIIIGSLITSSFCQNTPRSATNNLTPNTERG